MSFLSRAHPVIAQATALTLQSPLEEGHIWASLAPKLFHFRLLQGSDACSYCAACVCCVSAGALFGSILPDRTLLREQDADETSQTAHLSTQEQRRVYFIDLTTVLNNQVWKYVKEMPKTQEFSLNSGLSK